MTALCSYYSNNKRLGIVLYKLMLEKGAKAIALQGTFITSSKTCVVVGDDVSLLVFCKGAPPILITNVSEYAGQDKKSVEISWGVRDSIYNQSLSLCIHKHTTSKNEFEIEYAAPGHTIIASPTAESTISYKIKTPHGEGLLADTYAPIINDVKSIRSFRYTSITDSCEKEVSVKKGQTEIFKELAHYLNKVLLFSTVDKGVITRELCVSATGCCEVVQTPKGTRIIKVPFTKVHIDASSYVSALETTVDTLLGKRSITEALLGGV